MKLIFVFKLVCISVLLTCISAITRGQDTLTVGEIYNFSVGDEFHYFTKHADHTSTTEGWIIKKVIDVYLDTGTIIYTFQTVDSNRLIDTQFVTIPAHTTDWTIFDSIQKRAPDSTMGEVIDTTFAGRDANYLSYSSAIFDGTGYDCVYARGLGRVIHHASWLAGDWQVRLVYYKKGSEVWGKPLRTTNPEVPAFQIYPNPNRGRFFLNTQGQAMQYIALFDARGRLVSELDPSANAYDLTGLSPGLYYLRLQSGEIVLHENIVIR